MSRRRRKRNIEIPEISLTPLIDTALTLLIIFMVTAPMLQDSIKVKLPEVKSRSDKVADFCLTVYIDEKENIFLDKQKIDLKQLKPAVEDALQKCSDNRIISLKAGFNCFK